MREKFAICLFACSLIDASAGSAEEIKILTAGAFKSIVTALLPDLEQETGRKVSVESGTAGELAKRIEGGDAFDVVIAPPAVVDDLIKKGKVVDGSRRNLGRVGIGVMVKDGAPKPDVSSVAAFKQAVLAAKTVAYIDPASGGSSGVYLTGLFEKLGIGRERDAKNKRLSVKVKHDRGRQDIGTCVECAVIRSIGPSSL
jgi:molybdate transport system substrate-binding protein